MSSLETFVAPATALDGPSWLRQRRERAAARAIAAGLPTSEQEVWRYSPINDLDLDAFAMATAPGTAPADLAALEGIEPAALIEFVDGALRRIDVGEAARASGLVVAPAADLDDGEAVLDAARGAAVLDAASGAAVLDAARRGAAPTGAAPDGDSDGDGDIVALLNDALAPTPVVVRIAPGVVLDGPVVIRHHVATPGCAAVPRLTVAVGEGASAAVVEHTTSSPGKALLLPLTEVVVDQAARLAHVAVQELGPEAWQLGSLVARVGREATFTSSTAGLGGGYARLRTDCRLVGRGASGVLDAVYFGEDDQTLDFRTFQDHAAADTTSDLLYKGAVAGRSRSIYTGLIRVRPEGRGTNALQTNRNIKLSEGAWAESVPNLEIQTNDVRCAHASAVGPIDEEQRFYLESRGVPPAVAERLLVSGFFDEVLARLPVPGLAAPLRARIAAKLDRQGIGG